jgi:stage II sporulation protein D
MRWLWMTLIALGCVTTSLAQANDDFKAWREQDLTWIRVGLKKPQKHVRLYAQGKLLILDGNRVVDSFRPGGSFWIAPSNEASNNAYWVQIRADRQRAGIMALFDKLSDKFPDRNFKVTKGNEWFLLRTGPYQSRIEAEGVREIMVREGYDDAFIRQLKAGYPFQWVDDDFNSYPIKASNPAIVRAEPNLPISFQGNGYRGVLRFRKEDGKIRVINELPMETYLRGVVPTELGPHVFPELEALKAQAVAARTYAIKNMGRFNRKGYDICDTPACQAYEGTKNEHELSDQAIEETIDLVLRHGDELIDALYTSTCGGFTEDVGNVFPGRDEAYLRSVSSYVANYQRWQLPPRAHDFAELNAVQQDQAVRLLMWGFPEIPPLVGEATTADLKDAMTHLKWVWGALESEVLTSINPLTYRGFWQVIAKLPVLQDMAENQVAKADLNRMAQADRLTKEDLEFAAIALRLDLLPITRLKEFGDTRKMPRQVMYQTLLRLLQILGPEPEWSRYRVENMTQNTLVVSRSGKDTKVNLDGIRYYVVEGGGMWTLLEAPELEELDRVYRLKAPHTAGFLRVEPVNMVASVDRFSSVATWVNKKSVEDLEERARRYIKSLRGLKNVEIVSRSETGRVTELKYTADSGIHTVKGLRIRWSLGVRDNLFDLQPSYKNGELVHVTVIGRGWGHGVGMSQVGAYGLARQGWNFDRILRHYYTDVHLADHRTGEPISVQNEP